MAYIALHYVRAGGRMFTPGELLDAELTEEQLQRLIAHGAIREEAEIAEAYAAPAETAAPAAEEPAAVIEEAADTIEDAPEIDVMDGIVGAKKKPSGRRRSK